MFIYGCFLYLTCKLLLASRYCQFGSCSVLIYQPLFAVFDVRFWSGFPHLQFVPASFCSVHVSCKAHTLNVCCLWQCIFWGSYFLARIKNVIGDIILNNVIKFKKNHTNQYANYRIKVIINFLNLGPPLCFRCIEERSTLVIILMLIFLIKNELF